MTAKEMFESLGYKKTETDTMIAYTNSEFIVFNKALHKLISSQNCMTIELLNAINKQVEELGW